MDGLTPEQMEVEARFARWIQEDFDRASRLYAEIRETEGGRVIDADAAKKLSYDYDFNNESRTKHSLSVNKPAGAFVAKFLLPKAFAKLRPGDTIGLTAGGPGSGKSIIKTIFPKEWKDSAFVYDSVLGRYSTAKDYIEVSRSAGAETRIWYIHTPVEQAVQQAILRAEETGRVVPLKILANSHFQAQGTIERLLKRYANNPEVRITIIDNTGQAPRIVENPLNFLSNEGIKYENAETTEIRARRAFRAYQRERNPSSMARSVFQGEDTRANAGRRTE